MELRGFEPLTSAVQAPARVTGSSLPFLGDSSATLATVGAGLSPTPVPAPRVASASNVARQKRGYSGARMIAAKGGRVRKSSPPSNEGCASTRPPFPRLLPP